jgi:hypothetical protein
MLFRRRFPRHRGSVRSSRPLPSCPGRRKDGRRHKPTWPRRQLVLPRRHSPRSREIASKRSRSWRYREARSGGRLTSRSQSLQSLVIGECRLPVTQLGGLQPDRGERGTRRPSTQRCCGPPAAGRRGAQPGRRPRRRLFSTTWAKCPHRSPFRRRPGSYRIVPVGFSSGIVCRSSWTRTSCLATASTWSRRGIRSS